MADAERVLKSANENPWYVLMTLYGEVFSLKRSAKNRKAWNAWFSLKLTAEAQEEIYSPDELSELREWHGMREEILKLHEAEMIARNGPEFVYAGIPDVPGAFDFQSIDFKNSVSMDGMLFIKTVFFAHSRFCENVWISNALFLETAQFNYVTFCDRAIFHNTVFAHSTDFKQTIFEGISDFSEATFESGADFGDSRFIGEANFNMASFDDETKFIGASFEQEAAFRGTKFLGKTRFVYTSFKGLAQFPKARFGVKNENHEIEFTDCQFFMPTNFRMAKFLSQYPDFTGTVLNEKTTFTDSDECWPRRKLADASQSKESCATIRNNLGRQGLPEAEHFFFRREMEFAGQIGGWWERLPYEAFGAVSNYGYSILTPFLWLCLLIVGGASVLAWGAQGGAQVLDFWKGLGLSFSNAFNFLGFHKTFQTETVMGSLSPWMKMFSGFQSIAGVTFLFFLSLGLRTRFRMR